MAPARASFNRVWLVSFPQIMRALALMRPQADVAFIFTLLLTPLIAVKDIAASAHNPDVAVSALEIQMVP
jgi:hypothetical protein